MIAQVKRPKSLVPITFIEHLVLRNDSILIYTYSSILH